MEMEIVTGFISSVGFPIFVAVYMMTSSTKATKEQTKATNELTKAVEILSSKSDNK